MKLLRSVIAFIPFFVAASPALADIAPDPCSMGAVEGAACMTFSGQSGTCVAAPSGGSLYCKESSASGGGGGAGGSSGSETGGAGGSSGSGTGGAGGSSGEGNSQEEDSGCSLRAVGSAGAAGGAAVVMVAAGALLMRRRRARR